MRKLFLESLCKTATGYMVYGIYLYTLGFQAFVTDHFRKVRSVPFNLRHEDAIQVSSLCIKKNKYMQNIIIAMSLSITIISNKPNSVQMFK